MALRSKEKFYKACTKCGATFQSDREGAKYCSQSCFGADLRKPERTCMGCGLKFWRRSAGSGDDAGKFCSRDCAFKEKPAQKGPHARVSFPACKTCLKIFTSTHGNQFCGEACRKANDDLRISYFANLRKPKIWTGQCKTCSSTISAEGRGGHRKYCTACAVLLKRSARRAARREDRSRRKARLYGARVERFTRNQIFDRDGYRCLICGDPLAMKETAPHPLSPTIDHVVPLSRGGNHSELNVQSAHFRCNTSKGAKVDGKWKLIGWSRDLYRVRQGVA